MYYLLFLSEGFSDFFLNSGVLNLSVVVPCDFSHSRRSAGPLHLGMVVV